MRLTDRKRRDIIEAALAEFREQGFSGATTTRIAKRAGVSSRTLYNHFDSKEALFDAICAIMLERNAAMAPVAYDPARDLAEQLTEALRAYVRVITDDDAIGLSRIVISELLRDMERSRRFFAATAAHDYPITGLIGQAMTAGALRRADPVFAAGQLLALIKAFFFWPEFFLGEQAEPPGAMEDCVAMFLAYYTSTD